MLRTHEFADSGRAGSNRIVMRCRLRVIPHRTLAILLGTPNFARDFDHQPQLRGLLAERNPVSERGTGEAALRSDRKLIEIDKTSGYVNSALECVL